MERQKIIKLTDGRCNLEVTTLEQACSFASVWYSYLPEDANNLEHRRRLLTVVRMGAFLLLAKKVPDVAALQLRIHRLEARLQSILGVSADDWPSITVTEE